MRTFQTLFLPLILALAVAGCGASGDTGDGCGPNNCYGCCNTDGVCVSGTSEALCGQNGQVCNRCGAGQLCLSARCTEEKKPCGAATCPNGCCYQGACLAGTNPGACGKGGKACQDCGNGMTCQQQSCVKRACNAATCGNGCCGSSGNCITTLTEANCGIGGQTCAQCGKDQICAAGKCALPACTAQSCPNGCCNDQGKCVAGASLTACGAKGAACAKCDTGQACQAGKCACTKSSCASGCCEGDKCQPGNLSAACGVGGGACATCPATKVCDKGLCKTGCSLKNCPNGCCEGTTCKPGTSLSACGLYGIPCQKCNLTSAKEKCTLGTCNDSSKCNYSSCPKGCCKNSQCRLGTKFDACGSSGQSCKVCPPHMQCSNKKCVVKATSKWTVTVVEVEVDSAKKWDSIALPGWEKPDLYVELQVGATTKKTKVKDNTYKVTFNEYLLTATAKELMTKGNFQIKVMDQDPIPPSQVIASCATQIFEWELVAGEAKIYYCGSGSDLKRVVFSFKPVP